MSLTDAIIEVESMRSIGNLSPGAQLGLDAALRVMREHNRGGLVAYELARARILEALQTVDGCCCDNGVERVKIAGAVLQSIVDLLKE